MLVNLINKSGEESPVKDVLKNGVSVVGTDKIARVVVPTKESDLVADRGYAQQSQVTSISNDVAAIKSKIPSAATALNTLVDRALMNSSIASQTSHLITNNKMPFESLAELETYTEEHPGLVTNNDYAYVVERDEEQGIVAYDRYKYNSSTEEWAFEFQLNNSSFTAEQWAAITSGITAELVDLLVKLSQVQYVAGANIQVTQPDYDDDEPQVVIQFKPSDTVSYLNATEVAAAIAAYHDSTKQDVISDLSSIRSGAQAGSTALQPDALNNYYNKTQTDNAINSHHDSTKQDSISDLSTIRSGAAAGATAVQPSALDNYYTKSQADSAISAHHDSTKANDSAVVHTTGDETISGTKTFSNQIIANKGIKVGSSNNNGIILPDQNSGTGMGTNYNSNYCTLMGFVGRISGQPTEFSIGHSSFKTNIRGSQSRPYYNGTNELALYSDIPPVPTKTSDLTNDSGFLTQHQDISGKMDKSGGTFTGAVDTSYGEIKSFKCSHKGYTNNADWYFPVAKLPIDNSGNYASAIVNGRIGGWTASDMSQFSALAWQRGNYTGTQGAVKGWIIPANTKDSALNTADLVLYYQSDLSAILYVKCHNYYTFDFDVSLYQSTSEKLFNGTYVTTPSGTLSPNGTFKNNAKNLLESGSATWGGISGTLSNQTDLQNALNAKANASDIPTSVNGLSGGTITSTTTVNGAMKIEGGRYVGTGDDEGLIIGRADNNYAGVILGNPSGNRVVLYLKSDNTGCIRYNNGSTNYDIAIPSKAGTMAVTSDIPTMPHLYRHNIRADLNYGTSSNLKGSIAFNFYDTDATAFSSSSSQSRLKGASVSGAYYINSKSCNIYLLNDYDQLYAKYFNTDGTASTDSWYFSIKSAGGLWVKNIYDAVTQIF